MYRRSLVVVLLLTTTAGCAGLVGSETGGLLRASVIPSDSPDVEPVSLSEVDDDRLRRVTKEAVSAYESNGTAELVAVPIPERRLDETREAHLRLTERPDRTHERLVTYRGYTVRISMVIYT
jgi:hypothetical protein